MRISAITTERMTLRPFRDSDTELMQQLDFDSEVVRYLGHGKIKSPDESAANLAKILKDYKTYGLGLFAVYDNRTQRFIGRSGLIPWTIDGALTWEIGYSLVRGAWGQGYATELARTFSKWARDNLNVSHVVSLIHPLNRASIHVAEKVGMHFSKTTQIGDLTLSIYRLDF